MVGDFAPTLCTVQGVRGLLKVKLHVLLTATSPKGIDRRVLQCLMQRTSHPYTQEQQEEGSQAVISTWPLQCPCALFWAVV